ncbi:MAG: DEAD/DEAH box helicase [Candidatus Kariarchaeaceae archaeon]|jgi:ATP-dependent RNA helicase RhlE
MKDLKTFTSVVRDGRIIVNLPDLVEGSEIEVQVRLISTPEPAVITSEEIGTFASMGLSEDILGSLYDIGYREPTPVQKLAIPLILSGKDILATAQTGSGKTAAFALPLLQFILSKETKNKKRQPTVLILAPTRELVTQICENIDDYCKYTGVKTVSVYGGVSQKPQVKLIREGVDIIVATPGRLQDLMNQGVIKLEYIESFVLDEADRMLDMGFINDIHKIVSHIPDNRLTLLFSATMPDQIQDLASVLLTDPEMLTIDSPTETVDEVDSYVMFVEQGDKVDLLLHILETEDIHKVLIFTRTRHGSRKLERILEKKGYYAKAIHGDKSQNARERILGEFKDGEVDILVATDVASRGLDVDDITHVINYEMSNEPEVYIHRVGRTARAGKSGIAYNFCSIAERNYLREIERMTGEKLQRKTDYPHLSTISEDARPRKGRDGQGNSNYNKSRQQRNKSKRNYSSKRNYKR